MEFQSLPKNTALHIRSILWSCLATLVIAVKSFMWHEVMVKEAFAASFTICCFLREKPQDCSLLRI